MPYPSSAASIAGSVTLPPTACPPSATSLPIWPTVRDSYAFVLRRQRELARLALPWLLSALAVGAAGAALGHGEWTWTTARLLDWLGAMAVTVAWLRLASVGTPARWGAPLDRGVASLLLRSTLVTLLCLLPGGVLALLGSQLASSALPDAAGQVLGVVVLAGALLAAMYALMRLQLYVVAGALRVTSLSLADAWRMMRGHTARLVAVYLVVSLLGMLVGMVGIALGTGLLLSLLGPEAAQGFVLPSAGGRLSGPTLLIEALVRTLTYGLAALNATVLAALARHVLPTTIASSAQ